MSPESVIASDGRITIPKFIRDYFHLRPGDRIEFLARPDGSVAILPAAVFTDSSGSIPPR